MTRHRINIVSSWLGMFAVVFAVSNSLGDWACAQTKHLGEAIKTTIFSDNVSMGRSSPIFENGMLVQFVPLRTETPEPNIFLYTANGKLSRQLTIWPKGATRVTLTSVSLGGDGLLSVAGFMYKNKQPSGFLASVRQDGSDFLLFPTGLYVPIRACRLSDGTTWVVGASIPDQSPSVGQSKTYTNYKMLRHYSVGGIISEEFLPRWDVDVLHVTQDTEDNQSVLKGQRQSDPNTVTYRAPLYGPDAGFRKAARASTRAYIQGFTGGVILYDSRNAKLYKWNTAMRTLSSWRVESLSSYMTTNGLAVSSEGNIYASRYGKKISNNGMTTATTGIYELVPGSYGVALWKPITQFERTLPDTPLRLQILGADSNSIVYTKGKTFPVQVNWANIDN